MRNFIFPILILFCLIMGFIYVATNTPFVMNIVIPDIVNRHMKDAHIESFHCSSQKSQLPDILMIRGVEMKVRKAGRVFDVAAQEIVIHNFFDFLKKPEILYISGDGVSIRTDHVMTDGGKFKLVIGLRDWNIIFGEGLVFGRVFDAGPYRFEKISGELKGNKKMIEIAEIQGTFSQGKVSGKVTFDFDPRFGYLVWSEFSGVHPQSIVSPYPEFFYGIKGEINGSARIVGADQVDIFTVILETRKEAEISPEIFLKMKGAFNAEEEKELQRLEQDQAFLKAQKAVLHMQNSRNQEVLFVFDIEESNQGVVLKGRFPMKWEKGFEAFLFPLLTP